MPLASAKRDAKPDDCNAVLSIATKEQKDLKWKKLSYKRQKEIYAENSVEVSTELTVKQAEFSAPDSVIAALPDGELKDENTKKRRRVEYSVFLLNDCKANYRAVALLEKEFDFNRVLKELEGNNVFYCRSECEEGILIAPGNYDEHESRPPNEFTLTLFEVMPNLFRNLHITSDPETSPG